MAANDVLDLPLGTILGDNPFNVLGATVHSTRAEIVELAEERMVILDEQLVRQAQRDLTHPRRRLRAEVGWLPGLSPEAADAALRLAENSQIFWQSDELPPLPRANLLSYAIECATRRADLVAMGARLGALCDAIDTINLKVVRRAVDEARTVAGFGGVDHAQLVSDVQEHRPSYIRISNSYLQTLTATEQNNILLDVLKRPRAAMTSIHEVVDLYAMRVSDQADAIDHHIRSLLENLEADPQPHELSIWQIGQLLHEYGKLTSSVSLSKAQRGLRNRPAESLCYQIRSSNVKLVNQHGLIVEALKIQSGLRDAFGHIPELNEVLRRDQAASINLRLQQMRESVNRPMVAPTREPNSASFPGRSTGASVPAMTLTKQKSRFPFGALVKVGAAVLVLLFIGGAVADDSPSGTSTSSSASRPTSFSPNNRQTSSGGSCSGMDAWWDNTNARVDEANQLLMSLDQYSTWSEHSAVQRQILSLAREQRSSGAPSAAYFCSDARADMLEFLAYSLTDQTMSDYSYDQQFNALDAATEREAQRTGDSCGFEVTIN